MGTFNQQGGVAQLGERRVRNAEAKGSNPSVSTKFRKIHKKWVFLNFFMR